MQAQLSGEPWYLIVMAYIMLILFIYFLVFEVPVALIGTVRCEGVVVGSFSKYEQGFADGDFVKYQRVEFDYNGYRITRKTHFSRSKREEGKQVTAFYHPKRDDVVLIYVPQLIWKAAIAILALYIFFY